MRGDDNLDMINFTISSFTARAFFMDNILIDFNVFCGTELPATRCFDFNVTFLPNSLMCRCLQIGCSIGLKAVWEVCRNVQKAFLDFNEHLEIFGLLLDSSERMVEQYKTPKRFQNISKNSKFLPNSVNVYNYSMMLTKKTFRLIPNSVIEITRNFFLFYWSRKEKKENKFIVDINSIDKQNK